MTSKNIQDNAQVSGDAWVRGDAEVWDNAQVSGNAQVQGEADILCNADWFSFIYDGKTLTGFRSRNTDGYELNINGEPITKDQLSIGMIFCINELISKFTPVNI